MPDDPLFAEPATPETPPANGGVPAAPPAASDPPAATAGMSPEQVQELIVQSQAPLAEKVDNLVSALTSAREQAAASVAAANQPAPVEPSDLANELFTDPANVLEREVGNIARPLVAQTGQAISKMILRDAEGEIDRDFGDGTWGEFFEPELKASIQRAFTENPAMLLDETAIRRGVESIKGAHFNKLSERRGEFEKTAGEATAATEKALTDRVVAAVPMTGGFRRGTTEKPELSDEQRTHLDSIVRATGEKANHDRMAHMVNAVRQPGGMSREAWLAAKEASGEKAS